MDRFQKLRSLLPASSKSMNDSDRERALTCLGEEAFAVSPLLVRFLVYLSTRLDHVSVQDRWLLAAAHHRPWPDEDVREVVAPALSDGRLKLGIRQTSGPAIQVHRGHHPDHGDVLVRVNLIADLTAELEALEQGAAALDIFGWSSDGLSTLLRQFRRVVAQEREWSWPLLVGPYRDIEPRLRPPKVHRHLSTERVQVFTASGRELLSFNLATRQELARDALSAWLYALAGSGLLAVGVDRRSIRFEGGDVHLAGGRAVAIDAEHGGLLLDYLGAVLDDDPDAASEILLGLVDPLPEARPRELCQVMRQLVPLSGPGRLGSVPGVAETLLAQWRELARHGLEPRAPLLDFYVGVASWSQALAGVGGGRDLLASAAREVRVLRTLEEAKERIGEDWRAWDGVTILSTLLAIPGRLRRQRPSRQEALIQALIPPEVPRVRPHWLLFSCLLLVFVAAATWLNGPLAALPAAVDVVILGVLGAGLLWVAWRS